MFLHQITKAILFLHTNGHLAVLNLKPENIMLTKKGNWKIGGLEFAMGVASDRSELPFTIELGNDSFFLPLQPKLDYLGKCQLINKCNGLMN